MAYDIEVKPAPKQSWFTPAESNAYYKTRYSRSKVAVHWWGGGEKADQHDNIVNYFLKQGAQGIKSVNFVVSDRKITQMVDPANVAWATQNGNPESVSIEFQPTLSDEGYKRGGWLIATLEKKFGKMQILPHKHWFATACPGTIDLNRLRREADAASGGSIPPTPKPNPVPTPTPPVTGQKTVHLPKHVRTWAAYKVGSGYRPNTSDQVGTLLPSQFGGLTYNIVEDRGNVVVIDTQSYGRVAIWVKDTDAVRNTAASPGQPSTGKGGTATVKSECYVRTAPTTTAPLGGSQVLYPGNTFQYSEKVAGQSVGGNNIWYHSTRGNYVWSGNVTG